MLEKIPVSAPRCPFYANVSGSRVEDPELIRAGLIAQVENSVRFDSIVRQIIETGSEGLLEVGPGKVLKGLVRNIDRATRVTSLSEPESLREFASV